LPPHDPALAAGAGRSSDRVVDRRRFLLASLAGVLAAPLAGEGQPAGKVYRLGILTPATPAATDRTTVIVLVPEVLRELGYVEGRNIVIERRFADGKVERLPALAREMVQLRVDVIVTVGAALKAASEATKTIPIVFIGADPVGPGHVASLARPGGNIMGVVISETGLADKRLQLLREAIPQAARIAVLGASDITLNTQWQEAKKGADILGITLIVVEVADGNYDRAFGKMVTERAAGVVVLASPVLHRDRQTIIALASKYRLPAIFQWGVQAEEGGLMAYGSNVVNLSRRVAVYVDQLFRGAKPTELPVEQPTGYELVINLKTAKALGLTIPPSLLLRADQVIE
jgi:putative ABC transport system substrate-binding protein